LEADVTFSQSFGATKPISASWSIDPGALFQFIAPKLPRCLYQPVSLNGKFLKLRMVAKGGYLFDVAGGAENAL
jgi:hypothetical protein